MKKYPLRNRTRFAALAATWILAVASGYQVARAQSPSKYTSATITIVAGSTPGLPFSVSGNGSQCWSTSSDDHGIGISFGDDSCVLSVVGEVNSAAMRARITSNKIFFQLDGKSYSLSDATTVQRARDLFVALENLAQQQSKLGAEQRVLGEKQRDLGRQQREVKVSVPDMSADFQKVEADSKRLSSEGGTQSDLGDLQSELGDLQSRIGDLQSQAGDAQSKLGDRQSALGDQQSDLGDQQSALGDKSQTLAEAVVPQLRAILSGAVKSGLAKVN